MMSCIQFAKDVRCSCWSFTKACVRNIWWGQDQDPFETLTRLIPFHLCCGVMDNSLVKMRSMIFSLDPMCLKIPLRGCPETVWWCWCFWRSETETGRGEIRLHLSSVNKLGGHSMVTMMLTRLMATQTHSLAMVMVMVMTLTSLLMVDSGSQSDSMWSVSNDGALRIGLDKG